MIRLREIDVLGVYVSPAAGCFLIAFIFAVALWRALDRTAMGRAVWNRALIDLSLLVAVASLLILALRPPTG